MCFVRASSLSGFFLSSFSISSFSASLIFLVDSSSPSSVFIPSLKKCRSLKVPHRVCAYFMLLTLEMVDLSSPVRSDTSFRIIGFMSLSSPSWKNFFCMSIMAFIVT